ncbi:MAG: 4Fe-4S binding protein [Anaerolineales bacterium]|nr:4Fe-4S binding protein [Anaerolineales bacterium]
MGKIKGPSRWIARPWVTVRTGVQILALLVFLGLIIGSQGGRLPYWLVDLPMRLDPLTTLANILASRTIHIFSALALITIGITLLAGRAWCGWLCPLGTLLDFFSLDRWRGGRKAPPDSWRKIKYVLLLIILFSALFTNLTLIILDPLTLLIRTLTTSIWPALDAIITSLNTALYQIPAMRPFVSSFEGIIRPGLLPQAPLAYRNVVLFAAILLVVILLNTTAQRFWCRYLCPLGAILGIVSKGAFLKREVGSDCTECKRCSASCHTGTIQPSENYASDPSECTMCMNCLYTCHKGVTSFSPSFGIAPWQPYDPDRRSVLMAFGAGITGAALLRVDWTSRLDRPYLLRPPGTQDYDLISKCVRCGQCIRSCPTGALQPAEVDVGLEGIWTPILTPRMGYCDYSCSLCGANCPVEAIPPLSLEEKRVQVIGHAYIDKNRCIAWADDTDCIVCEEMCPLPEKAIILEEAAVQSPNGETEVVQRPQVIRESCIGCGICEYKCPVQGEAAIRVYVPSNIFGFTF